MKTSMKRIGVLSKKSTESVWIRIASVTSHSGPQKRWMEETYLKNMRFSVPQ